MGISFPLDEELVDIHAFSYMEKERECKCKQQGINLYCALFRLKSEVKTMIKR